MTPNVASSTSRLGGVSDRMGAMRVLCDTNLDERLRVTKTLFGVLVRRLPDQKRFWAVRGKGENALSRDRGRSMACSYCGSPNAVERDHVIPKCLYPRGWTKSAVQLLTVPACRSCNGGWSDDEARFRNVLMMAGNPNEPRQKLWTGPVRRSFRRHDGLRRMEELAGQIVPTEVDGQPRHKIYPGRDPATVRIVRKILRGLVHYHGLGTAIADDRVVAEILTEPMPAGFAKYMRYQHRDPQIVDYFYAPIQDGWINSFWLVRFFQQIVFQGEVAEGKRDVR